ncbi:hypothetical protein Pa4123_51570 [Phytohabitans aurantiacus]|uniref:HTH cro/C1-type domain-containing protein n=1 Tax=Phytohabitans aurantiacus TaxID=3016789 RepID=A0ABQ5QZA4_9ACTN|nr:hypothetical protein Pa4123_51570 [Phytohabitans aurantiacus]
MCHELRRARSDAGYTRRRVCEVLGWSLAKQQRIETGQVGLSPTDLRALLDIYGVHDRQARERLEQMAARSRREQWSAFRQVLTAQTRAYLNWEGVASRLRHYEPLLIPELLRTEAYAWAVIRALAPPDTPQRLMRLRLEACLARQAVLDRDDPPSLYFVIEHSALYRPVRAGNTRCPVMTEQVQRLCELTDRPNISIQVLSPRLGLHRGLAGPFTLLDLCGDDSVVYLPERAHPALTTPDDVADHERAFVDLAAAGSPLQANARAPGPHELQPIPQHAKVTTQ